MDIRLLDPDRDLALVRDLFGRSADYVLLDTGGAPDATTARDFFASVPPGGDSAASRKLGLFGGEGLAAIADLGFGYPEPEDAYLGLLLVDPAHRGAGLGPVLLARVEALALARGAPRLVIGVLEANPRARAFWERQGFRAVRTVGPVVRGRRTHLVHRMVRPVAGAGVSRD